MMRDEKLGAMSKPFSTLNMGDLRLVQHRAVVLSPSDYAAVSSGLIVSDPIATSDAIEMWRRTIDHAHDRGGLIVSRLVHPAGAEFTFAATVDVSSIDGVITDYAAAAQKARRAGRRRCRTRRYERQFAGPIPLASTPSVPTFRSPGDEHMREGAGRRVADLPDAWT